MRRGSLNSHRRQYNSVNEEAMARLKHQNLLQEFLELQKVTSGQELGLIDCKELPAMTDCGVCPVRAPLDNQISDRRKEITLKERTMKEFVSKKKKLQTVNQKRETLLAEVGFLRQRYSYLSMIKSQECEQLQDSVQSKNPYFQSKTAKNYGINETDERRQSPLPDLDPNVVHVEGGRRSQADVKSLLRKEKPKNCLINRKRSGKKKISWQDQVALKV